MSSESSYYLSHIRELLTRGFDDAALRALGQAAPDLQPACAQLADDADHAQIVDALLDYAIERGLIPVLLAWAKERNPEGYVKRGPYRTSASSTAVGLPDSTRPARRVKAQSVLAALILCDCGASLLTILLALVVAAPGGPPPFTPTPTRMPSPPAPPTPTIPSLSPQPRLPPTRPANATLTGLPYPAPTLCVRSRTRDGSPSFGRSRPSFRTHHRGTGRRWFRIG